MPDFAYIARDAGGNRIAGVISAQTERDAVTALSGKSLFPVQVAVAKESAQSAGELFRRRRINGQLMAATYGQLAGLLRSGVPLLRSLEVIKDQTSNATLADVLTDVYARVEDGSTLGDAMARHKAFSEMAVSMVRAGGEGGFLEDALDRVAVFTETQEDLKARTIGALAYPIFLAVVGTLVVGGLLVFFVPSFEEMFANLREQGELPAVTEGLLWFSESLKSYGLFLVIALVLLYFIFRSRIQTDQGRRWRDRWLLKLPVVGSVFQNLAVARFCRVLGTLLGNGVGILKSLEISRQAAGNWVLSDAIGAAAENISAGESLAKPLAECGHFPPTVVEMIAVAEESNSLDTVLVQVADGLDRSTQRRLDLAVRLLEPIMLLILAGVVLLVVSGLLLPVLKMSSTV